MTRNELIEVFKKLDGDDRFNLINSFIRWWSYGERDITLDGVKYSNKALSFDRVDFGVAVVRNIAVLDSTFHRVEVSILPYELFIKMFIIPSEVFIASFYKYVTMVDLLSQLVRFGKPLTYPDYFKSKQELLEG